MVVLVTGAAGFIGGHLYNYLRDSGFDVLGVDSLSRPSEYVLSILGEKGYDLVRLDVRDILGRAADFRDVSCVVHLASYIDVAESLEYPYMYFQNNVGGTASILEFCREVDVDKFIFISSAAVYGEPKYLPLDERHPLEPISPYGYSKLLGEELVGMYSRVYGLDAVILRLFNVYGLGQSDEYAGVISRFISRVRNGLPPIIFGDGGQTRDFIHVDDVCRAVEKVINSSIDYEVFNVASGTRVSINELASMVIKLSGLDLEPIYTEPRPGDIKHSYADITKIKSRLGFKPRINLFDGIKELMSRWDSR